MTALNKQALRQKAVKAGGEEWQSRKAPGIDGEYTVIVKGSLVKHQGWSTHRPVTDEVVDKKTMDFIAAANPATVLALLDELEAAKRHIAELESFISQSCYVFDGRDADISDSYIDASTSSLMPKVSTKNEGEPCRYCSDGSYSGLPGGACEHCMGTGLDNPAAGIGVKGE